jgi:hypothetical protein
MSGGGLNVTTTSGTTQQQDAIHLMETTPSPNGSTEENGTNTDDTYWLGDGGTGGMGGGNYTVQPFGVCFTDTTINGTQFVVNSISGPTSTDSMTPVTATCPSGTLLLGGGAQSTEASNESATMIGDYPSDSSGDAVADGSTNPTSWTAVTLNGSQSGTGNTTTAYAVCSGSGINVSGITVTVKHAKTSGPTSANGTATATTATCGTAGNLVSGGASISGSDPTTGSFTVPGSYGDHLVGDYPSDSSGNLASNGASTVSWTAIGHGGGMSGSTTETDVWGLCMS